MLIGTAGHIDHGKTTLIRALTGVNTDRLPEEQRRGISIDLGFAYLPSTETGEILAFIDVPGHEKFVPTMLAGASGIDFVVLVIAADDGPMPQTKEHLDIVNLLGITRGAIALTKTDRATHEQRTHAEAAIRQLLAGGPLANAPLFPIAAPSGAGIDDLRQHLFAATKTSINKARSAHFRLPIDRSFSIAGAGTVVTGSVLAGSIQLGDTLHLQSFAKNPEGCRLSVRVRSLHANNRAAESAGPGSRCAINLVGIERHLSHQDIERGDWLLSPVLQHASQRLDIELIALPGSEKWLRAGIDLHLHHAAQHGMGRLVPLDAAQRLYQIVASTPFLACHGDRLIIRDASGRHTLAAGRVLDPCAPLRQRSKPERLQQLSALQEVNPEQRLARLLDASPGGVNLAQFAQTHNALVATPISAILLGADQPWAFAPQHFAHCKTRISDSLQTYHAKHADELGLERERLRRIAAPAIDSKLFAALLAHCKAQMLIACTGNAWHLPSHRVELSKNEQALAAHILPALLANPYDPPWVRDLANAHAVEENVLRVLLRKLAAQGEVFQVVRDLFYHRDAVRNLAELIKTLTMAGNSSNAAVKAAALRDATGLGRKRAIQILEFFDRVGYTRRVGSGQQQAHVLRGEAPVE